MQTAETQVATRYTGSPKQSETFNKATVKPSLQLSKVRLIHKVIIGDSKVK